MILLHSVLLLVFGLLAPSSLLQAEDVFSQESIILWDNCGHVRCYCMPDGGNDMKEHTTDLKIAPATLGSDTLVCNVGIQIRYFNDKSAIVEMQVMGKSVPTGSAQLIYYQGKTKLFGCAFEGGKVALESRALDTELKKDFAMSFRKYRIELFEDQSKLDAGNVYCAIKIGRIAHFKKWLDGTEEDAKDGQGRPIKDGDPTIKLTSPTITEDYAMQGKGSDFFDKRKKMCDPFSFKEPEPSSTYHVLPVRNRHRTISCDGYKSYTMRYKYEGDVAPKEDVAQRVECLKPNGDYELFLHDGTSPPGGTPIKDPELYTFFCTRPFEEICTKPASTCTADHCPQYTEGAANKPATLTCPEHKWIQKGEFVVLAKDPVCEQDAMHPAGADFKIGDEKPGEACFKDYDCKKKSILDYPACINEPACALKVDGGVMRCNDTAMIMRIVDFEANTDVNITGATFTCDGASGVWKNATGSTIPEHARVRCDFAEKVEARLEEADLSDTAIYCIIGGVGLVALIGIIICYRFLIRWCRRRNEIHIVMKKEFKKMKKKMQISFIKDVYATILKKPTGANIVEGLHTIQLLLETETAHSECWIEVFIFLRLFLGSIETIDISIVHLTYRYLYLKARDIIKKHGWEDPGFSKPNKDARNRLIRVVAIRLLAFCLHERETDDESAELIESGFRTLGWDMAEQYPHCGLLWSLVQPSRLFKLKKRGAPTEKSCLKWRQFMQYLYTLAIEGKGEDQKPADLIAEFGSPAQQAAYALGRLACNTFHTEKAKEILQKTDAGDVPRHYFLGLIDTLATKNPVPLLTEALSLWPTADPAMVTGMRTAMSAKPFDQTVRYMLRVLVACGNHLEAKRMETAFLPAPAESNLEMIASEQLAFEEAIGKADREQFRGWFAARTDRAELKRPPVYFKARPGAAKPADAQVESGSQTPGSVAGGATPPTGSGSSSTAGTPPAAATPEPVAAAAATPAAAPAVAAPANP